MYQLLAGLRAKLELGQVDFAKELGTDQAQISRLEKGTAGRSFHQLCEHLRNYARKNPRQWLELLAAGESSGLFSEYLDLFFITERLSVPFAELWVVSELPAECQRRTLREQIARQLLAGKTRGSNGASRIVYWAPEKSFESLRTLAYALLDEHGISDDILSENIEVISSPAGLALLPVAIIDPREDARLGFLSAQSPHAATTRVVVLPSDTTARLFRELEQIYRRLRREESWEDPDNYRFVWKRQSLLQLIQAH